MLTQIHLLNMGTVEELEKIYGQDIESIINGILKENQAK